MLKLFIVFFATATLFSCSTLSGGTHQKVKFSSSDPTASFAVYPHYMYPRKSIYTGKLPAELELSRKTFYIIEVIINGEIVNTLELKPKKNHTDAVTFALIPGAYLVDTLISGGGFSYPEEVILSLIPSEDK
jgi:hypothetical protein